MSLESRQLLIDDLKIYSEGLVNALKQDKLREAREYVASLGNAGDATLKYLDSHISLENNVHDPDATPSDAATTEADRAALAAKRAHEKVERLERAAKESREESKRLQKAAGIARKEAEKARKAAEKAEKAETKAQREAKKAADQASKANQAARRS